MRPMIREQTDIETLHIRWPAEDVTVACDIVGQGPDLLLLPALSTISTRAEMHPLARLLAVEFRCVIPDWPGFGNGPRPELALTPALMKRFLADFLSIGPFGARPARGLRVLAAGHAATYAAMLAAEAPGAVSRLVLVSPTWRGPLPTAMGGTKLEGDPSSDDALRRPLWRRIRRLVETPVVGPLLYALNVNAFVIGRMLRSHVYGAREHVTAELVAAKTAVTRHERARLATAAFITGGLDPVLSREAFRALFRPPPAPTLVLRGVQAPRRSAAEMDSLAGLPGVEMRRVPGALAPHEEYPAAVAEAARPFLAAS